MTALSLRFVVVASDADDARFIRRVLEDHGDHVHVARDAADALSLLAREPIDAALVSMTLPRGDGLAVVHHLRALHSEVDVIVLAGAEEMQEAAHAMALGVLTHVVKPLTGDALLVAADRVRERRMLVNERARLVADEAVSRKRSATYARCAAFVAETDAQAVASRVLDACVAELPAPSAALYRRDPAVDGTLVRAATVGEGASLASAVPVDQVTDLDPTRAVHALEDRVRLVLLGDVDVEAVVDLVPQATGAPGDEVVEGLEIVAALGTAAFVAARKVDAMARVGIKDPETSAYTFSYFGDVAGREIDRASRYGRRFAMLTIQLEGLHAGDRHGQDAGDQLRVRRDITDAVLDAVRDSDVLARVEDDELYLLLPETGLLGALACRRRIESRFERAPELATLGVRPAVGIAVYPTDGADLGRLLRAGRQRVERSRSGVWRRLALAERPFWQAIDALLGNDDDAGLGRDGRVALHPELSRAHDDLSIARHAALPASAVSRIGGMLVADAVRHRLAGTVYVAGDGALEAEVARAMNAPDPRLRAWILGRREGPGARLRLPVDDPRLGERVMLLSLTEVGGYVLLARSVGPDTFLVYHTSDLDLVDGLVTSLQRTYHLQPELT
ncbi:MAG: response regulator [Myxococcota bacterium]